MSDREENHYPKCAAEAANMPGQKGNCNLGHLMRCANILGVACSIDNDNGMVTIMLESPDGLVFVANDEHLLLAQVAGADFSVAEERSTTWELATALAMGLIRQPELPPTAA